jgi:hypothetical protein
MSQYIRLKRRNRTVFLHVEPSDNFGSIKQRLAGIFEVDHTHIMLLNEAKVRRCLLPHALTPPHLYMMRECIKECE